MKLFFFISILISTYSFNVEFLNKEQLGLSSLISVGDVKASIDALLGLVQLGEDSREVALHNQSVAQSIYDTALGIWQTAFDEEQAALGVQLSAEEAEAAAVVARDNAIDFKNNRIKEKSFADGLVPPAEDFMNSEIARVDEEKASLEKVKSILEGLIAGPASDIEEFSNRKLLSRTAAFFSNPTFLSSLSKADPAAVQSVLDIVLNLIQEGEDARNYAIGEYNARVEEAAVAAQNLVDAETALASREAELVDATDFRIEMTSIAEGKTAVEVAKREIRDAKKEKLDIQIAFTNREIARIDGEKEILERDVGLTTILQKIVELLA